MPLRFAKSQIAMTRSGQDCQSAFQNCRTLCVATSLSSSILAFASAKVNKFIRFRRVGICKAIAISSGALKTESLCKTPGVLLQRVRLPVNTLYFRFRYCPVIDFAVAGNDCFRPELIENAVHHMNPILTGFQIYGRPKGRPTYLV